MEKGSNMDITRTGLYDDKDPTTLTTMMTTLSKPVYGKYLRCHFWTVCLLGSLEYEPILLSLTLMTKTKMSTTIGESFYVFLSTFVHSTVSE